MKGFHNSATELKNVWDEKRDGGKQRRREGRGKKRRKEGKSKPLISLEIENCIRNKGAKKSQYFIKDIAQHLLFTECLLFTKHSTE